MNLAVAVAVCVGGLGWHGSMLHTESVGLQQLPVNLLCYLPQLSAPSVDYEPNSNIILSASSASFLQFMLTKNIRASRIIAAVVEFTTSKTSTSL